MSQQRFEVQRHLDQVYVARQNGDIPQPGQDEVLIQIVACGICGADIRVMTGNKVASGEAGRYTALGHEGVGRVVALGRNVSAWQQGDYAVILPHVHRSMQDTTCLAPHISPVCIGNGHTLHMGWDIDGCFTDFMVVSTANLVHITQQQRHLAVQQVPGLGEAIFALVEPMLCTLSAYEIMKMHLQGNLPAGRALVIGCGPIGILHSLALLERGFEVWITDVVQKRVELALWCLDQRVRAFDPVKQNMAFDLAMVTASSAAAIQTGEAFVRKGGIVYLFAGLNTVDRSTMDKDDMFFYEPVHRKAQSIHTTLRLVCEERPILYLGHSGVVWNVAFSQENPLLVSSGKDREIRLWDSQSGECVEKLYGSQQRVRELFLGQGTKTILTGSSDNQRICIRNIRNQDEIWLIGHTGAVRTLGFHRSGKIVASGGEDQTLRLWDVETRECRVLHQESEISSIVFSPDEEIVAGGDNHGSLYLWNIRTGKQLTALRSEQLYEKMNISGTKGLSGSQREALLALGAIEQDNTHQR